MATTEAEDKRLELFPTTEEGRRKKAQANRAMFDGIAHRYDVLNRMMSLGMDHGWRRRLVNACAIGPGSRCLDLCCGTGDVVLELLRRGAQVTGLDASGGMLAVAQQRTNGRATLVRGDAMQLPFPDNSFDAVTISFGNRNVASLHTLYAEMARVTRPGGRVASLEVTCPTSPVISTLFFLYFTHMPAVCARLMGSDVPAYGGYLPESVRQYPAAKTVAEIMRRAGLRDVTYRQAPGAVMALHWGVVA